MCKMNLTQNRPVELSEKKKLSKLWMTMYMNFQRQLIMKRPKETLKLDPFETALWTP